MRLATALLAVSLAPPVQAQQTTINADFPVSLVDTPLHVTVSGLLPKQLVRMTATSRTFNDRALIAYAVFRADDSGNIDVSTSKPMEGTYSKADPMGLFWSMVPQVVPVGIWRQIDLQPFWPPKPWTILLELAPDQGGNTLANLKLVRLYSAEGVRSVDVRESGLVGKLALPRHGAGDRFPGVILLGGSEGGLDETGAMLLASHGYAALALAYFGAEGVPSELVEIPVEYSIRAFEWLQARPEIDRDRIGIMGRSRGSELALLTASFRREVRSVIAIGPSCVLWGGIPRSPSPGRVAAWTYEGKALPFLSAQAPSDLMQEFYSKGPLQSRLYDFLFSDHEAVEKATIPIERIHGRVLLISGKEDRVWGSPIMAERIVDRARRFDQSGSVQNVTYDDTGHNIREPYRPTHGQARLGGTAEGHARAEQDSWRKILAFLEQTLGKR